MFVYESRDALDSWWRVFDEDHKFSEDDGVRRAADIRHTAAAERHARRARWPTDVRTRAVDRVPVHARVAASDSGVRASWYPHGRSVSPTPPHTAHPPRVDAAAAPPAPARRTGTRPVPSRHPRTLRHARSIPDSTAFTASPPHPRPPSGQTPQAWQHRSHRQTPKPSQVQRQRLPGSRSPHSQLLFPPHSTSSRRQPTSSPSPRRPPLHPATDVAPRIPLRYARDAAIQLCPALESQSSCYFLRADRSERNRAQKHCLGRLPTRCPPHRCPSTASRPPCREPRARTASPETPVLSLSSAPSFLAHRATSRSIHPPTCPCFFGR